MNADISSGPAIFSADARLQRRKKSQTRMKALLLAGSSVSGLFLVVMLWQIFESGIAPLLSGAFWTRVYNPLDFILDKTPGLVDSLYASAIVLLITIAFALPIGTAAGVYLHEYSGRGRLFRIVDASVANLAAVPSIVYGLFGLVIFVLAFGLGANYIAAGMTLGVLILPMLIVSTQEALKNVPDAMRHASLAMGATKWQTIRHHILPYALPNILTGQILALSRAAGETAPLIVLGIPLFQSVPEYSWTGSGSPLQLRAFDLASEPSQEAIQLAGGAILLLMLLTLTLNLVAIILRDRLQRRIKW